MLTSAACLTGTSAWENVGNQVPMAPLKLPPTTVQRDKNKRGHGPGCRHQPVTAGNFDVIYLSDRYLWLAPKGRWRGFYVYNKQLKT